MPIFILFSLFLLVSLLLPFILLPRFIRMLALAVQLPSAVVGGMSEEGMSRGNVRLPLELTTNMTLSDPVRISV